MSDAQIQGDRRGSNKPAISVLVPIYNTEKYLREALDSLVGQAYGDFEAILINDGSTDGSRDIIQEYLDADPRFRVIDKPNSGYGASMNVGLSQAEGQYIAALESDDFFEPDALQKLITPAIANAADVVKANYWYYWSGDRPRSLFCGVVGDHMAGHVFCPADEPDIFFANPSIWSGLYRRDFLIANDIRFNETPGASFQDTGFTFKVWACAERVFCITDAILRYRQDNETSSVNNPKKVFCVCDEFDSIEKFLDENPSRQGLRRYALRLMYDSYMWNFGRLTPELRAQFLDRMIGDLSSRVLDGDYDESLFKTYQSRNLEYMMSDPIAFLNEYPVSPTRIAKARYYAKVGGLSSIMDMVRG